jgi:hypothetical protein
MKVVKIKAGEYAVTIHNHTFTLERLFGCPNWTLYNAKGTEVQQCETKAGMLQVMRLCWSERHTQEHAAQDFCTYA